jgi:hypothetical protein
VQWNCAALLHTVMAFSRSPLRKLKQKIVCTFCEFLGWFSEPFRASATPLPMDRLSEKGVPPLGSQA